MPMHVMPNRDERAHVAREDCWCKPTVMWLDPESGLPWHNPNANPMVAHHAADCREVAEEACPGESIEAGKDWTTIVV